jgi:hypothetical protein
MTFWILAILVFLTLASTIFLYIKQTKPKEVWHFNSLSTLLQTLFVFVTLLVTIYTIQSSSEDTQTLFSNLQEFNKQFSQMESSLADVSVKLKEMPEKIEAFGKSIGALNNTIDKQTRDFQANTLGLNQTIGRLSSSVDGYRENIDNYSQQLTTIVDLTNKQLVIWKEQQRVLLDEFSRKPVLFLRKKAYAYNKDTCEVTGIDIGNDGDIEANIRAIFLFIPSDGFIGLKSEQFVPYQKGDGNDIYRFVPLDYNTEIVAATASITIACSFKVLSKFKDAVGFRIDYYSKYKSGREAGLMRPPRE